MLKVKLKDACHFEYGKKRIRDIRRAYELRQFRNSEDDVLTDEQLVFLKTPKLVTSYFAVSTHYIMQEKENLK